MKKSIHPKFLLFVILFLYAFTNHAQVKPLPNQAWLEDLEVLDNLIKTKHVKPYWVNTESTFEAVLKNAKKLIQQKGVSQEAIALEFLKLIATIKDGHSSLSGSNRYELFGYLPFSAEWFGDKIYIIRAHPKYKQLLGAEITAVNGRPIDKVMELLEMVVPHANTQRFKKFSPYYLHLPGVLYGLGITSENRKAELTIRAPDGKKQKVKIEDIGDEEDLLDFIAEPERSLYAQKPDRPYWFKYFKEDSILYLNYNRVTSINEDNVWAFCERLFQFIEDNPVDKFIVDIRENGGGSNAYSTPIWYGIINNPKINQAGKLFVITGYKTFSAAINFACYLEQKSKALFIGEPVCDHPIHPGDPDSFELPNSKFKINLSQFYHESSFYMDERTTMSPDITVDMSFEEYSRGQNPIIDFVKRYKKSSPELLKTINPKFLGTYQFSPYEKLDLIKTGDAYAIKIGNQLQSPLYLGKNGLLETEIKGLQIDLSSNENLAVIYPDGKKRQLSKTNSESADLYQFFLDGRMKDAYSLLLSIQNSGIDTKIWKDYALTQLALEVYYDLKGKNQDLAKQRAREILNMAIELNPNDNEYASYSLRFY